MSRPARICVVGAGAIGGYLAAKLAVAGHDVAVVARGAQLAAIESDGLTLISDSGTRLHATRIRASERVGDFGPQDFVLLTLKAHQVSGIAPELAASFDDETSVVAMQNGIPWWYFQKYDGPHAGHALASVDPGGKTSKNIPAHRIIGSVVNKAAYIHRPGVVHHSDNTGDGFALGELDGAATARIGRIAGILAAAGVPAPVVPNIRDEKWYKLWGNLAFNPICALTQANCLEAFHCEDTHDLAVALMEEARCIAEKLGVRFRGTPADRMMRIPQLGPVRPSMLQDTQSGRSLEVGALLGSVVELGRLTDTGIPHIESIHACTKLLTNVISSRGVRIVPESLSAPQ